MKKINKNDEKINRFGIISKISALILLFIFSTSFLLSGILCLTAFNVGYYQTSSSEPYARYMLSDLLDHISSTDLSRLAQYKLTIEHCDTDSNYYDGYYIENIKFMTDQLEEQYSVTNSNVMYVITSDDGNIIASTFNADIKPLCHIIRSVDIIIDDNRTQSITIDAYVRSDITVRDSAYYLYVLNGVIFDLRYICIPIAFVSFCLSVIALVFLCAIFGKRKGEIGAKARKFDNIPLELILAVYVFIYIAVAVFISDVTLPGVAEYTLPFLAISAAIIFVLLFALTVAVIATVSVRIKTGILFKRTLVFICTKAILSRIKKILSFIFECAGDKKSFLRASLFIASSVITDLLTAIFIINDEHLLLVILLWLFKTVALGYVMLRSALDMHRIIIGSKKMVEGELNKNLLNKVNRFCEKSLIKICTLNLKKSAEKGSG